MSTLIEDDQEYEEGVDFFSDSLAGLGGPVVITVRIDVLDDARVEIQSRDVNDDSADRWQPLRDGIFTASDQVRMSQFPSAIEIRAAVIGPGLATDGIFVGVTS